MTPPVSLAERVAAAKSSQDFSVLIDAIPYARWLGLSAAIVPCPGTRWLDDPGATPLAGAEGPAPPSHRGPDRPRAMPDELITTMPFSQHVIGNPTLPALHGGALGALLESAAIFELLWRAETVVLPKTITLTIDYLRSAAPVDTHACGVVTRQGRRITNVRMEAWQVDRNAPVVSAHAVFLVMRDGIRDPGVTPDLRR